MIVMETIEICYCGGYVPLFVTVHHRLSSCVLLWINTVVFCQLTLCQLSWRLSSWIIMTVLMILPANGLFVLKTIISYTSLARREC